MNWLLLVKLFLDNYLMLYNKVIYI